MPECVAYEPEMGEVKYLQGFYEVIKGLHLEAQFKYFRITHQSNYALTNWSERTMEYTRTPEEDSDVKAWIVKDGCVAGVMMLGWYSKEPPPLLIDICR